MAAVIANTKRSFEMRDRDGFSKIVCELYQDDYREGGADFLSINGVDVNMDQLVKLKRWLEGAYRQMRRSRGHRGL